MKPIKLTTRNSDRKLRSENVRRLRISSATGSDYPIIVFSHLGWDWVWQRPQQFISRFSKKHPILFVEGPIPTEGLEQSRATLREVAEFPNIVVMQMAVPASRWSDGDFIDAERRRLVKTLLAEPLGRRFENPLLWFYDPMAVSAFAGHLGERAVVYDCMDQLSQFRGAPPELIKRERELLSTADVVFAGGPKIHRSKVTFNANCHSYGCGVDTQHFGKALKEETKLPKDVAHLQGPILGYFGCVDERLDYELLGKLADADPNWHVVIVGPAIKVNPEEFPKRANLHWLGGRDYSQLPAYVKAFDVCLMPFAINEATEFINPTKALEYLAAGTPVVSSAIEDVVLQYSGVVDIADSQDEFIEFCKKSVAVADPVKVERGLRLARQNSWEAIVAKLEDHIEDVLVEEALESSAA